METPMIDVQFTEEEVQKLIELLDVAVRVNGLQVAEHALPLAIKLQKTINK
jgi:hypothetical protein